jgi:hypothetical protein
VKLPSVVCGFLVIKLKACLCGSIMVERSRFGDCLPGVFICFIPYGCLSLGVSRSRSGSLVRLVEHGHVEATI